MPRDVPIIFHDLVGKLTVLRIECEKCGRSGENRLDRLNVPPPSREGSATAAAFVCRHSRHAKYGAFGPRFVSNDRVELRGRRKYNPVIRETGDPSVPVDADDGGRIPRNRGRATGCRIRPLGTRISAIIGERETATFVRATPQIKLS